MWCPTEKLLLSKVLYLLLDEQIVWKKLTFWFLAWRPTLILQWPRDWVLQQTLGRHVQEVRYQKKPNHGILTKLQQHREIPQISTSTSPHPPWTRRHILGQVASYSNVSFQHEDFGDNRSNSLHGQARAGMQPTSWSGDSETQIRVRQRTPTDPRHQQKVWNHI